MKWRAGILYRPELGETKYHAVFDERNRIIAATGLVGCECEPESIEHAALIAAAPELLEACISALETINFMTQYSGMTTAKQLEAAIAKAKGVRNEP